jgi:hypothetical protein
MWGEEVLVPDEVVGVAYGVEVLLPPPVLVRLDGVFPHPSVFRITPSPATGTRTGERENGVVDGADSVVRSVSSRYALLDLVVQGSFETQESSFQGISSIR